MSAEVLAFTASGPSGELFCGARSAGTFEKWQLEASGRWRWTVEAEHAELNEYRIDHGERPFTVKLYFGGARGAWVAEATLLSRSPLLLRGESEFRPEDGE